MSDLSTEGANSKRPELSDSRTQEPMRAGLKPVQQRKPSTDQKKVRRQMQNGQRRTASDLPLEDQHREHAHSWNMADSDSGDTGSDSGSSDSSGGATAMRRGGSTEWETAHNGNPAMRVGDDGLYYNHNGEPRSAECTSGLGLGCDGTDCSCSCHSPNAPFFRDNEDVARWHKTSLRKGAVKTADIDRAGHRECEACGYVGEPTTADGSGPICSRCGSYSVKRQDWKPSPTSPSESARSLSQTDYARTAMTDGQGYHHNGVGQSVCNDCSRMVTQNPDETWRETFNRHDMECPAKDTHSALVGDKLAIWAGPDQPVTSVKTACRGCACSMITASNDPIPTCQACKSQEFTKQATQFQTNVATADGRMLLQRGDSIRTPTGQTMKVNDVRRHETSKDHYYLDTDAGTTVVPYSTAFEVVPSNQRQQPLPGFGTPGGNSNELPFSGGEGTNSPVPSKRGPGVSNSAPSSDCPVCGGKNTLHQQGDKYACSRCGYQENFIGGGPGGGMSFSDSPQTIRQSTLDTRSVVARRASNVANQHKENPL